MKQAEFLAALEAAAGVPTAYDNHFPRNLGYYDGKRYSFDCWNLIKAVLAGWKPGGAAGSYTKPSATGDIDGAAILARCAGRSRDFSALRTPGAYLYLASHPHAGIYVGEVTRGGKAYNVIECTAAFGGGVVYSYVDGAGRRLQHKGGKQVYAWTEWGLLPWVTYGAGGIPIYRLYNPNSGEHFLTASAAERDALKEAGWNGEGTAFHAPDGGADTEPVLRLYDGRAHLFTADRNEAEALKGAGWKDEGEAFRAGGRTSVLRLYNPRSGLHHWTADEREGAALEDLGWEFEGVAWTAEG